jgi:uncharacterized membrane protein YhaH (DUF805 family)
VQELSPIEWALRPVKKYAVFSGRAPRAEYWWYGLATTILSFLVDFIARAAGDPGLISGAFSLALILPGIAVTVRRLHDVNRSGWWLLLLIVLISFVVAVAVGGGDNEDGIGTMSGLIIVGGLAVIAAGLALFVFSVLPGTEGPNRYSSDPYGPDQLQEVFA